MVTLDEKYYGEMYVRRYVPKSSMTQRPQRSSVLFLHGYPGHQKNYDVAEHMALKGFCAYVMHYRGVWKSKGQYSLLSIYKDVESILKEIQNEGTPLENISLIGVSWGAFVAMEILTRFSKIRKIALLAPFANIGDDEAHIRKGSEFLASITEPAIKNYSKEAILKELRVIQQEYNPLEKLSTIDGKKVLIIHGVEDQVCPIAFSRELKKRFRGSARLYELYGQDHFLSRREVLNDYCLSFLES